MKVKIATQTFSNINNNPTCRQFEAAYKRLLLHTEIKGVNSGNAIALDNTSILCCPNKNLTQNDSGDDLLDSENFIRLTRELEDRDYMSAQVWHLTTYTSDIVAYISGFVAKCLKKCVTCASCSVMLESDTTTSLLQRRKQYGRMYNAYPFTIKICQVGEKCLRLMKAEKNIFNLRNINSILIYTSMRNLPQNMYETFGNHFMTDHPTNNHCVELIKLILNKYFKIRLHNEAAEINDHGQERVRKKVSDCKQDVAGSDSEEEFVGETAEQSEHGSESEIEYDVSPPQINNQDVFEDQHATIRRLCELLNEKSLSVYCPSENLTIDEQLIGFRGRFREEVYIPNKPNKYGIKIIDANDVVVEPVKQSCRNITTDNWYTSTKLAKELLTPEYKLILVGTLNKRKLDIPLEFLPDRNRPQFGSLFGFHDKITLVSYIPKPKKALVLLSTMHNDIAIDTSTNETQKPEIITHYNDTKGGVDCNDQLCATHNLGRRTKRWPLVIFFHLLNVSGINQCSFIKQTLIRLVPTCKVSVTASENIESFSINPKSNLPHIIIPATGDKLLIDIGSSKTIISPEFAQKHFPDSIYQYPFEITTSHGTTQHNATADLPIPNLFYEDGAHTCYLFHFHSDYVGLVGSGLLLDLSAASCININFFIQSILQLGSHNEHFGYSLRNILVVKKDRNGLISTIHLKCNMCNKTFQLRTSDDKNDDVNDDPVLGIMTIGSTKQYTIKCIIDAMRKAAEEQKEIALAPEDDSADGISMITAVAADGSWSKRSYRNNYNSVAAAIHVSHTAENEILPKRARQGLSNVTRVMGRIARNQMSPGNFKIKTKTFLDQLAKTEEEIQEIQTQTKNQRESIFGRIRYARPLYAPSIEWEIKNKKLAIEQLEKVIEKKTESWGLFTDPELPYLAASPDRLLDDQGLIEIKCPWPARDMILEEGIINKKITC
ncbi:hypothetical protein ILUMI_18820 [Ignelater luminosus]|uniref:YqaJ viral recombinase domain-containing protein n=1 Tax=Ignelater luminosus TaxID=2038154 RepID=A0A8K0G6H2_IGNLU|nr:hypothetical protein ILUMI_18820 [Ignelater luminosus]